MNATDRSGWEWAGAHRPAPGTRVRFDTPAHHSAARRNGQEGTALAYDDPRAWPGHDAETVARLTAQDAERRPTQFDAVPVLWGTATEPVWTQLIDLYVPRA